MNWRLIIIRDPLLATKAFTVLDSVTIPNYPLRIREVSVKLIYGKILQILSLTLFKKHTLHGHFRYSTAKLIESFLASG